MPAPSQTPIIFLVNGEPLTPTAPAARGTGPTPPQKLRAVRITASTRGTPTSATPQRLEAVPGEDIVVLTLGAPGNQGQGPDLQLRLHPENARDLLLAQTGAAQRGADSAGVQVPLAAQWQDQAPGAGGPSRGMSDLVFKGLELVGLDPRDKLAKLAASALGRLLDGKVNEGVYALQPQTLGSLKTRSTTAIAPSPEPILVLVHGTFVDTDSTFSKWWGQHPGLVTQLFQHYGNRVYALDHATVMRSPIANALTLAQSLPQGARLHLVTHSRGGLVAEVLLRASLGVTPADLALFEGDGYAQHRQDLQDLARVLADKQVVVERTVRVACPAYGTLLASDRLDAYLSALVWLLRRTGLQVLPELLDFADAVARERANPTSLPGIEAMRRGSPVIEWLNQDSLPKPTANTLRVVAGDLVGDSLGSWVKTLLADSFYWTDNDIVVQTSSMYGGVLRAEGQASFMLDRSGKADHFSYFLNDGTANGIANALTNDRPAGFAPIGPLSQAGEDAGGLRGAAVAVADDGTRPAVIVLPGILGSNLKAEGTREWLVWYRVLGLMDRIAKGQPGVVEDGPLDRYYKDLIDHLGATHQVLPHGFDWRVSLRDSATLLAQKVQAALDARKASGQPVRLLAHSMGSILLRVMQLDHPAVWKSMMAHKDARVLMLGPPHAGSWAPMTLYTGDDNFGRFLATVGGLFQEKKARDRMAEFVGLLQLQAGLTDPALNLGDASQWAAWAQKDKDAARAARPWHSTEEQTAFYEWALPAQADLADAAALRRRLDAQLPALAADAAKMAIVLGQAPATPCGVTWGDNGMQYQSTAEGDGRVTWASARLPGVPAWKTNTAHGDLASAKGNFEAYAEILASGSTARLDPAPAASAPSRGGAPAAPQQVTVIPRLRDSLLDNRAAPVPLDTLLAAAMGSLAMAPDASAARPLPRTLPTLTVEVVHGDLRFVREPLLLGHMRSLQLTGSEHVVNGLLGNALQQALDLGVYPEAPGQRQIFINQHADPEDGCAFPRPAAAVVVGLGDEGELTPLSLATTVRQAVLAYQRHAASSPNGETPLTLASTTLGSGGNLSVSQCVVALVKGVTQANAKLAQSDPPAPWPPVTCLRIVELYGNRALEAWHALRSAVDAGALPQVRLLPQVCIQGGGRSQPPGGRYRGASYDLVRVVRKNGAPDSPLADLEFSLSTARARSEISNKDTQRALVDAMVAAAEQNTRFDAELARSLYLLLVPQDLKAYLGSADTVLLELDVDTASYPWEMLDLGHTPGSGQGTQSTRTSGVMLRKMRVKEYRRQPADAPTEDVLVIGSPQLDKGSGYADLPGARAEAQAVADLFGCQPLLDLDFLSIMKPLLANPWKIIHLAGHGLYEPATQRGGMLMSDKLLLGPAEVHSMDTVPELVFVNCCYLGKTEARKAYPRGQLAANMAEQLIREGVRCVVAAGWAVDDAAAKVFALSFYTALKAGETFAEAVRLAREATYIANPQSNTWAAFQCYGDPAWTLYRKAGQARPPLRESTQPVLATVDELLLALEVIGSDALAANAAQRQQLADRLRQLEAVAVPGWLASGRIAEKLGLTWLKVNDSDDDRAKALQWLGVAVAAQDGSASLSAREQQLKQQVRAAKDPKALSQLVKSLDALIQLASTAERWSLLGSAQKRLVMHSPASSHESHLRKMMEAYGKAEAQNLSNDHYPGGQRCLAQLRLHWLTCGAKGEKKGKGTAVTEGPAVQAPPSLEDLQALRQSLAQQDAHSPDFWSVAGHIEVDLLEGLISCNLDQRIAGILHALDDLHARVTSKTKWGSVADTAEFLLGPKLEHLRHAGLDQAQTDAAAAYLKRVQSFGN